VARTRQKAKQRQAKRREKERQAQGTTGQKPPSTPAEQAVVDQAEAYEVADAIEESGGDAEAARERIDTEESDEAITPVREEEQPGRAKPRERAEPAERAERPRPARAERRDGRARQARAERRKEPRQRGRVLNFLVQVWAELRRVQWPDRAAVTQATAVVIVFCLLAGFYLAFFDYTFNKLVKFLL
jgi:preprotein translocase SecE subunit